MSKYSDISLDKWLNPLFAVTTIIAGGIALVSDAQLFFPVWFVGGVISTYCAELLGAVAILETGP